MDQSTLSKQYARFNTIGDEEEEEAGPSTPGQGSAMRFDTHPPPLTIATGEHALELARQAGDSKTTAMLCRLLCSKYLEEGDASKGRELLVSVVSLYKEMGESKMEQECDILFGQVAQLEGQLDVAIAHFTAAAKRLRAGGEEGAEATQRLNIGRCYELQAQVEKARVQYQCALELAKQLNPPNLELVHVARTLCDELGAHVPQALPPAAEGASSSFLQRAKEAGWDDESDSDEDIVAAKRAPVDVHGDVRALDAALADAATLLATLQLDGREKEAAELQALMRAEMETDDDSDSDVVDCEELD